VVDELNNKMKVDKSENKEVKPNNPCWSKIGGFDLSDFEAEDNPLVI